MDLAQRLSHLESVHDWHGLVEELEKGIASEGDAATKAAYHLKLGQVLEDKFLQSVKALKHFQDAYKLNPALLGALEQARAIYWDLGKVNMVQKLLELELRNAPEGELAASLLIELGDVLCEGGDFERATATYARALGVTNGTNEEARARLEDMQVDETSWEARVDTLVAAADQVATAAERRDLLLRAARLTKRFDRARLEGLLTKAYEAEPSDKQAAAMFEGLLAEEERAQAILDVQRRILNARAGKERADAAFRFGVRWATRHQNVEIGAKLLEEALSHDPGIEPAFAYLRELWGTKEGNWERVLTLAESTASGDGASPFMVAQAGAIAWRQLGNLIRARSWFERLAAVAPEHPTLRAFEAQIGEQLSGAVTGKAPSIPPPAAPAARSAPPPPIAKEPSSPPPAPAPEPVAPESEPAPAAALSADPAPEPDAESALPPPTAPAESAAAATAALAEKLEELRSKAQKQEQAKRFNEYVKTLIEIAELVPESAEKVENYEKAAELYTTKFSNAAEAVKCYEAILAIDGEHRVAIDFLRQSYEKRRDWEKLIGLMRREAAQLPEGGVRAAKYLEIAKLATERVKKPEVCIELWDDVIQNEPDNAEALAALSALHERAKDWEALARVLQQQVEITFDAKAKETLLGKLGALYGERLNNDEAAVEAWRQLLALNPQERKAQEALKKLYLKLGRLDELEDLYAESGKWDEFIRVLEAQEAKETDNQAKIGLGLKLAQLWLVQKQKSDRAAKAYEKVLSIDPTHLGAAEALIPIYEQASNSKGLAGAIEVKLSHDQDDATRLELYRQVAGLYETRLKEPQRAFERYLAAFQLAPHDERSIDDVERVARVTGGWDALIRAYAEVTARAESDGDVLLGIDLRLRLGRVLLDEVKRVDDALAQFRAVYDADSENGAAIAALERLYRETGRFQELLGIYQKKLELTSEPTERKQILYAIAELYEGELRDPAQAITTYCQVLDDEPMDAQALAALDKLYREQELWESYVDVLRKRIELEQSEHALVDLKLRLGTTLEHLGDPAGALENYREILFLDPGNDAARMALEALLENEDLRAEAAAILQEIYESRGDWEKLIQALEILAAAETDVTTRVTLLRKVARTAAENLGDLGRAFDAQARALKDDPSHAETRAELEALAAQASAWDRLDGIFSEIAESLSDARLSREYWMRLAGIHERLGKVDEAANGYLRVLSIDPADDEALAAMDELYRRTERWSDLIGVYRRRIELAQEPAEREALYAQMAQVFDQRLGQPEEAIAAYREVLTQDPASTSALTALDSLFSRQGMWEELADNLEAQLNLATEEDQQIRLMLRLAALRESKMHMVESAIDIYSQVLEREPSNPEALAELERLGKLPEHELAIAEILEPLYRQSGDYPKLIGVHEVQVRRSDDVTRRVELLHQIAILYEDAGGDMSSAFDTYARALQEDPASEATQQSLDRLARATGRFADLAHVYETLAARQSEVDLASALYTMSAQVYEQDLGDMDSAVGHYRRVLEIDPSNLHAAESLERIFQTAERYQELSQILQQKAEILDDLNEKKAALFSAASIEEDVLERHDPAIAVYGKVLELDSEDLRAIDALIKLYLGLSRWQELLSVYQRKADLVVDADEKKRIYYQIGAVYERELGDVPSAIDTYQRVLEIDPDDLQALGRLDVLYQHAQNWAELLSVLQRESELASDPAESISYQYRIAELYEKHLDDVARAIELYRDLLQQMPDHEPTLKALEAIKDGAQDPLGAALVLEPIYDASGEWQKLISVLEVQVRATDDAYAKVDLLHRIARLAEEMLNDHIFAFETYARAVTFDIANEDSLSNLERLAMIVNRWQAVAALYDAELGKLGEDPARFVDLGLRLAQIFETQLEDVDNAVARYRRVLEVEPENKTAISSLDRLFSMTERWSDLVEILAREVEIADSPEEILEFKYRLGVVHQTRLNDLNAAIAAYGEVLAAAPEHTPTLEALEGLFAAGIKQMEIGEILEPLYQAAGEWEKLAGVLEAELTHLKEESERLAMYYRLAELHEERLISLDGALGVYIRALKEYPGDEKTLEEVERLAGSVDGGWEMVANAYADVLGLHAEKEVQTAIGKRLARVFEYELGDVAKAEETYRYVLGVEPLEVEALANLDRIYTMMEQYPELASVLEQRVKATQEQGELVDLYLRLGQTYEERLGQNDDAIRAFRRIFDELEPANDQAIQALERIYTNTGAWTNLKVVLDRELENALGDSEQSDILAKMAHLLADRLNDIPSAVETWKRVLELRGEDPEALGALANLYERQEQWAELCDVLERHFDIAPDDESRVAVLLRRAKLFNEQLNRADSALDDYNRVLDIDYANLEALYAISAIWRTRGDADELLSSLHQTVDRARDALPAENLVALFRELGTIYQQPDRQQSYDAIDAWRKLLEVDPRDFEAMAALENLLRAEERWEEVIEVKMGRAAAYEAPAEQVREYLEIASLWEHQVGNKDKGTLAYERILEIEPGHDQAYFALEELHGAAGRAEPLIELYLARLELREDVHEKTDILRKVAKVFEEQLEDKPQAFDALLTAFEMDFDDMETVRYLERMAAATNRWPELVQTVNGWLQQQTDDRQIITLCLRLAKWYAEDLGHPEYSQPYYQKVLEKDPNNVAVLRQMANFFKKTSQWQMQGQTLTSALNVAVFDVDRKEILTELGEVLEGPMADIEQAMSFYKRALDVDPLHLPALEAMERIYTSRDQPTDLVDILLRKAKALTDPQAIAAVKLRTGGLYETTLGQTERAGGVYREVLDIDGANLLAMRGLERVYGALQQWPDLVRVLEMQLDVVTTERERIDVLMKIARIQEEQFLKPDLAAQRLEQVVEIDPNNEQALEGLERCYRRLRQWLDLINAYDRHIQATLDRAKKIELWAATAKVYAEEVQDLDRAIDAYLNIVDLDDSNIPAQESLAKLYERQDDPLKAIEYMSRVADLTPDGRQRVEMYYRIGKQLDEKIQDKVQAQERFEMALDLDPRHLPTLAALRALAADSEDWDRAARYLDQEQMYTEAPRARAKLLVELGRMRDEKLVEHDLAVQSYEMALQSDPDNEDAAMPLFKEYVTTERWQQAEPLGEMLVKKAGKRERGEQLDLQKAFGKVLEELGKNEQALRAYQAAHTLNITDMDAVRGLADVSFKLQDWPSALTNYQKILPTLPEEETEQRATVYYKLGCIKQAQGQAKQAINNFEKALGIDPAHVPTLQAMVSVYESLKDWKQVCHYKRQILDGIMDGGERFKMLNDIADIWISKENNIPKGIEALEEALDLEPQNHVLLHNMLQQYQKTGQWSQMVDTLQRIADIEPQPDRRSRYLFTMAQIYRDKLDDQMRAVDLFNEALDLNPGFLEAFERINKILTALKEWKQLERAYRKMLHRVAGKGNTDLEFNLWHALGLIYRDRLGDRTAGSEAFKMASRLKPEDMTEHLILAEIYEQSDQFDAAIAEYQAMVKLDPMRVDPYKRLYRLYVDSKQYDPAWCVAGALAFLRKADQEEQQYYEDYRPQGLIQAKSRLDNQQWIQNLFHEEENLYVGKIFEMLAGAALQAKIKTLEAQKQLPVLDPRFRQDPATSTVTFARTFGWAANVLGLPAPLLYVRSDVPGALVAVPNAQPASVAGQTVLTGFSPQELTFICGKHLAMYRGEHYIKTLFPTVTELTVLLFAGMKLVVPETPVPQDIEKHVVLTAQQLKQFMQPMQLEGLRMVVKKFIADGAKANIKRWVQCVDITAARAGLLLCADMEIARKILAAEPQQPGDLPPQDKLKELLVFATSEQYFSLRHTLGIAIGE